MGSRYKKIDSSAKNSNNSTNFQKYNFPSVEDILMINCDKLKRKLA